MDTCETCRFWEDVDDCRCRRADGATEDDLVKLELAGPCRRFPPFPAYMAGLTEDGWDGNEGAWPWTKPDDWCGEWKPLE